jgi:hypothetical protein
MNSFFTLHIFLEVGKTQDLPSKFCQTLGDALTGPTGTCHFAKQHLERSFLWLVHSRK